MKLPLAVRNCPPRPAPKTAVPKTAVPKILVRKTLLQETPVQKRAAEEGAADEYDCQACGACCCNSAPNKREKYIDYVEVGPHDALFRRKDVLRTHTVVNDLGETHLKLVGREQRCIALEGTVGKQVTCTIYQLRPLGCRAVEPGSAECKQRRKEKHLYPRR